MRIVTIRQAARELQVCERTLRDLISEGRVPAFRVGDRLVRLDLDEVLQRLREGDRAEVEA